MLKGISPYLSPDLLKTLYEMGHGDELLLADVHFPGHTLGRRVVRADGLNISQLLDAILRTAPANVDEGVMLQRIIDIGPVVGHARRQDETSCSDYVITIEKDLSRCRVNVCNGSRKQNFSA